MRSRMLPILTIACVFGALLSVSASETINSTENIQSWRSEHFRDHPLVGRIYAVADKAFVSEEHLVRSAAQADYVLLGETHTNTDHHLLQAAVIAKIAAAGRRPKIILEMISVDLSEALAAYLSSEGANAEGLGAAINWQARGWPDWAIYQPIAEAALTNGLTLHAGDIDRALRKRIGKEGLEAMAREDRVQLALDQPLGDFLRDSLKDTLRSSHCGMLPETAVEAIYQVQRARDAALADAMLSAGGGGAVLIAGRGHARGDYGVPWYLRARRPTAKILTVGIIEVEPDEREPTGYLGNGPIAAFDYLWFTPKNDISDHCAELKKRFGKPDE